MNLCEIGVEQELWLMKGREIVEPSLYGFPSDEMGFLVELRSEHSDRWWDVLASLNVLRSVNGAKARHLEFQLEKTAFRLVSADWARKIAEKYKHASFEDRTHNIYNTGQVSRPSHHTGFIEAGSRVRATAGLHVHFSRRTPETQPLPVEAIVSAMDLKFQAEISAAERVMGEWEPKAHGFEYRSLPCTVDVGTVVRYAMEILLEHTFTGEK